MAINFAERYAKQIQTKFTNESIVAGKLNNEYSFSGARTVKIYTPVTVPMVDYTRSGANRYGEPAEMQDTVQELTMTQDKSFALTVDKGNNSDQMGVKEAGKMLDLEIREQAVPMQDKYIFSVLAHKAGNIVKEAEAISNKNVVQHITNGTVALDDAEVPQGDRYLYVPAKVYAMLRLSPEWIGIDDLGKKALEKGVVGEYDGMKVVKVNKARWPENVNFIIAHKKSATAPVKINDAKYHVDPPGLSGNLLEGRVYFDCFVLGAKAEGIYVEVATAGDVLAAPSIADSTGVITPAGSGTTVKYTTDGSDPRYSMTAKVGTSAGTGVGVVVKAYEYKEGSFDSPVTTVTLTA